MEGAEAMEGSVGGLETECCVGDLVYVGCPGWWWWAVGMRVGAVREDWG